MRVIHIVHGKANPEGHNGISRVVYHLNKHEKELGIKSEIWAVVDGCRRHFSHRRDAHVTVECFPRVRLPFGRSEILHELAAQKEKIDLIHFHMIWFYDKNIIASSLTKLGIPYISTTHGTYTTRHAYTGKRRLARTFYELPFLRSNSAIHALTREEGTGLQKYGYDGPLFVVPNGVSSDEIPQERWSDYFSGQPYAPRIKAIWVGVLRDDKNIRSLIKAVSLLPHELQRSLAVIMVGPDYKNNMSKYRELARQIGVGDCFQFVGPLYGKEKFDAIESSDFFIMPSHTEGMSLSVLDAMACGKPGVMTMGCGMNYYLKYDFIVPCEPYSYDLANGLMAMLDRRSDWSEMGHRGRVLCANTFDWSAVARSMKANYASLLGVD